ncbi:sugar porter family MFS transporter [Shewanella sp. 4_MG-2023]|uniref:sugar porter family MFS transporter n=1 Tax=Shewanella sp. 4_MG-2023 TaxID=3062652 RepID=UPI0026E25CC9|nr:sugar porter family MFS transporter [Shewanella sp. 4_MG-2023]MDO6680102.1 sugar porter family MFS transporter [Shewanella sp. 4_MG-2023]
MLENTLSESTSKESKLVSSQASKSKNIQAIKFSLIAAFGGFVFGLDAANISGALRFVSSQFELTSMQTGNVVGCAIVGVILALFFTGSLCQHFGRKKVLLAIALTYSLSTVISAFANSYEMLVVGRFIGGVAFASITVSAMYIGEIAPAKQRGQFVSVNQLLITLGSLVAFVVNYFLIKSMGNIEVLTDENIWRVMLGFELVPNIIWFGLLLTIPESPRWLMSKQRHKEAEQVFSDISDPSEVPAMMDDIKQTIAQDSNTSVIQQLKLLFSKPMRFLVILAVCYAVVQGATGMNAVLFYAPTVFEQIGMSVEDTFLQTIVLGAMSVLFTLVAIFTVEKWGRKVLTVGGLLLITVAHCSIWYGFGNATYVINQPAIEIIAEQGVDANKLIPFIGKDYHSDVALKADLASVYSKKELPLVSGTVINASININPAFVLFGLFAFLAAFNMSIGPIMWVIFSEIFSSRVRSVALPFAALVQSISSWSIQQFFPWQLENMGAANTFLYYGGVAFVGCFVMMLILPETKGKSIEAIERQLVKQG